MGPATLSQKFDETGKVSTISQGTGKAPVMVEILRQELMSCKRQLKDQQASNSFLKKEKFKSEHEKNLM